MDESEMVELIEQGFINKEIIRRSSQFSFLLGRHRFPLTSNDIRVKEILVVSYVNYTQTHVR